MNPNAAVTPQKLQETLAVFPPPTLVDARRQPAFEQDPHIISGALKRPHETIVDWADALEPWRPVVVYCVRGHEVSQDTAAALRGRGFDARYVEGGLESWRAHGGAVVPFVAPTRWVTRAQPKIDRIACPWLIRRFLDPAAEFFYVPNAEVRPFAAANAATAYDIPDVPYSHVGEACSFDAFIRIHGINNPALELLATIVRGADTDVLALAPQAPGLLAVSLGLSKMIADDLTMLRWGMLVYDALYAWCRDARGEAHGWNPAALRV